MMWLTTLAVIVLIIYLVRGQRDSRTTDGARQEDERPPLDVLDRQYAAGKLTTEEYKERKEKLLEDRV